MSEIQKISEMSSTFWAEFKILRSAVSTVGTAFPWIMSLMEIEEIFTKRGKVSFFYFTAYFFRKFAGRIATAHFCKMTFIPFEKRNKEEGKIRIGHKNLNVSVFLTAFTNNGLIKI